MTAAPYVRESLTFSELMLIAMGRELQLARKATTDFTQKQMALKLGWSPPQVGKVERGETPNLKPYTDYMDELDLDRKAFFMSALASVEAAEIRAPALDLNGSGSGVDE